MLPMLNLPMVKEALVLATAGVIATLICGPLYAASLTDAEQAAPTTTISAPAPAQLAPIPQDQAREMLLAAIRGQTPIVGAPSTDVRH